TLDIYRGAAPFVVIQLVMIVVVLLFPAMATPPPTRAPALDPIEIERQLDDLRLPGLEQENGFGLSPPRR
ncbi:MAG: C4-dicarboxylate ABC transporter, partial [Salinarimonas sp.]